MTISRKELLVGGSDRDFRRLVHNLFALMARHDAVRGGHARRAGLPSIEYTILISIAHLEGDGEVNVKTVAEYLHMSGAFVTTVTRRLQGLGLLEKVQDVIDRRRVTLHVTDKGSQLLESIAPYQRSINDVVFEPLTRKKFVLLSGLLEEMIGSSDRAVALQRFQEQNPQET